MKKSAFFMITLLALVSCKENVSGRLEAFQNITLNTKKEQVQISQGTYRATLGFNTKKKLTIKLQEGSNEGKKITIKIPKNVRLGSHHENTTLRAAEIGQPYDLKIDIDNIRTTSDLYEGSESCNIYVSRTIRECKPDGNGGKVCTNRTITDTIPGRRFYTYFYETDNRKFELDLMEMGTDNRAATFDGSRRDSRTVRLHETPCLREFRTYRYDYYRTYRGRYGRYGHRHL